MNFQHKYELVEAELCRVNGQILQAIELYDRAIHNAIENGYGQEAAIANERAGLFYLSLGQESQAKAYLTNAYHGYVCWGAIAKIKQLSERYRSLIHRNREKKPTTLSTTSTYGSTTSVNINLDFATVMKAAEAIASEIELNSLLRKFLQIVLENAAAQKGCLLLTKNDQLFIEAAGTNEANSIEVLQSIALETSLDVPISLIHYVARTQQPLVLSNAMEVTIANSDPYIQGHQLKSVLCAPILYQGEFTGVVYLENALTAGAFTPSRLEILKLLTSQAAIAIRNAQLYAREQENSRQLKESYLKLQQTQAQLVQTEKISSLGQLVAGVAHEVNNPVGFVSGNLEYANQYIQDLINLVNLYQKYLPEPPAEIAETIEAIDLEYLLEDLPQMIKSMKLGTDRIRDIMQSLRNFSRADGNEKRLADVHEGIESTLMILQHRLKAQGHRPAIQVIKEFGDIPEIRCFAGQLNQVFMNLLANAIDALEESNQGKTYAEIEKNPNVIRICTGFGRSQEPEVRSQELKEEDAETRRCEDAEKKLATNNQSLTTDPTTDLTQNSKLKTQNSSVVIRISNNGRGMPESIRQKLFEPFFTTKPEGRGTGLGLSISQQIVVEKHNGSIICHSSPTQGTEFVIELPLS